MSVLSQAEEAAAFVRGRSRLRPTVGLVLGSGLGAFAQSLTDSVRVPYGQIPHFPTATAMIDMGSFSISEDARVKNHGAGGNDFVDLSDSDVTSPATSVSLMP